MEATANQKATTATDGLHRRNRHQGRYDFRRLVIGFPALGPFVARTAHGDESIDFADPAAVKVLNTAILAVEYGIAWNLPGDFLCPPIPGRADLIHHLADLLAEDSGGAPPRGSSVRVLDIGVGANAIYPLLGAREYGWSFVGSDIDSAALAAAGGILKANPRLRPLIELRRNPRRDRWFSGVVRSGETFTLSLCNPPFHDSPDEARAATGRKLRNLGRARTDARSQVAKNDSPTKHPAGEPIRNFGGTAGELWCPGGEVGFITGMIAESATRPHTCRWFTSLVAKAASLPRIEAALRAAKPTATRIIPMAQGQKQSRIVAWTFYPSRTS